MSIPSIERIVICVYRPMHDALRNDMPVRLSVFWWNNNRPKLVPWNVDVYKIHWRMRLIWLHKIWIYNSITTITTNRSPVVVVVVAVPVVLGLPLQLLRR